jgi:hypothetical protein
MAMLVLNAGNTTPTGVAWFRMIRFVVRTLSVANAGNPPNAMTSKRQVTISTFNWLKWAEQIMTFFCWRDGSMWLGYLRDWPDYWTQGTSFNDLIEHLQDLYHDLSQAIIK